MNFVVIGRIYEQFLVSKLAQFRCLYRCFRGRYTPRICFLRPEYHQRFAPTQKTPAACRTYTWASTASDETRLGAISAGTSRSLAFPRVGCAASSAFSRRARPVRVSGDRGHSFAPSAVSRRRVLTALPLRFCVKSRVAISGHNGAVK